MHEYPPNVADALADHEHDYADALRAIGTLRTIDSPHAITMRLGLEAHAAHCRTRITAIYYEHHADEL